MLIPDYTMLRIEHTQYGTQSRMVGPRYPQTGSNEILSVEAANPELYVASMLFVDRGG